MNITAARHNIPVSALRRMLPHGLFRRIKTAYWGVMWRLDNTVTVKDVSFKSPSPSLLMWHTFGIENEINVLEDLLTELSSEDVFLDVGGFVGTYTCLASAAGADVITFEPAPANYDAIRDCLQYNDLDAVTINAGLADKTQTVHVPAQDGITNSGVTDQENAETTLELVHAETYFDETDLPSPDIIKIDVEGAERNVLSGLGTLLDECRVIYIEVHPNMLEDFDSTEQELLSHLESHGFDLEELNKERGNTQYILKGTKSK